VLADPQDACSALAGEYANKVVLFTDGSCDLQDQGENVRSTDAVAGETQVDT